MIRFILLMAFILPLFACAEEEVVLRTPIILQSPKGAVTEIMVEIADTHKSREKGFMGREEIPTGTGMLFVWPQEKFIAMWMKNTPHPLDMLFIQGQKVVKVISNTTPFSENLLYTKIKIDKVLELPAGDVKKFNFKVGWKILSQKP